MGHFIFTKKCVTSGLANMQPSLSRFSELKLLLSAWGNAAPKGQSTLNSFNSILSEKKPKMATASVNLEPLRATLRKGRDDGYLPKEMAYVPDVRGGGSNLYFSNPNRVEFDREKKIQIIFLKVKTTVCEPLRRVQVLQLEPNLTWKMSVKPSNL